MQLLLQSWQWQTIWQRRIMHSARQPTGDSFIWNRQTDSHLWRHLIDDVTSQHFVHSLLYMCIAQHPIHLLPDFTSSKYTTRDDTIYKFGILFWTFTYIKTLHKIVCKISLDMLLYNEFLASIYDGESNLINYNIPVKHFCKNLSTVMFTLPFYMADLLIS